jgi:hypothetical protein
MVHPLDHLLDDRSFIEVASDIVRRRADQFDPAIIGLMVGLAISGDGTVICALHFLHVVFLPACDGETLYFVPHAGHGKTMVSDIVDSLLSSVGPVSLL